MFGLFSALQDEGSQPFSDSDKLGHPLNKLKDLNASNTLIPFLLDLLHIHFFTLHVKDNMN